MAVAGRIKNIDYDAMESLAGKAGIKKKEVRELPTEFAMCWKRPQPILRNGACLISTGKALLPASGSNWTSPCFPSLRPDGASMARFGWIVRQGVNKGLKRKGFLQNDAQERMLQDFIEGRDVPGHQEKRPPPALVVSPPRQFQPGHAGHLVLCRDPFYAAPTGFFLESPPRSRGIKHR
jgi:hypothetical protein